jgi:hypothetical protein
MNNHGNNSENGHHRSRQTAAPCQKLGSSVRYRYGDLMQFIDENRF